MKENNIRHRAHQHAKLTNAILSPLSEEHDWQDIEVVTLKQAALDRALDHVLDRVVVVTDVNAQLAYKLSTAEYKINREFISISPSKITIAILCDVITDRVMNIAMDMLMAMQSFKPGVYYSGPEHIIDFSCGDAEFVV